MAAIASMRAIVAMAAKIREYFQFSTPFSTPYGVLGVPISKVPHFGVLGM